MLKRIAVAALFAAGLSNAASATTVTYLFTGVVDQSAHDGLGCFIAPVGTPFTATLAIELATPGSSTGLSWATAYDGAVVSASFSIESGSGMTGARVSMGDGVPGAGDGIQIDSNGASFTGTSGSYALTEFQINIDDADGTVFSSQMLQIPTDLSEFESARFFMRFLSPSIQGHLTSIQLVPEPSLAALLGTGLLVLALRRWSVRT